MVYVCVAIPKIVRIIDLESPSGLTAGTYVPLRCGRPCADLKVLIATKLRCAPNRVHSSQRVLSNTFRVSVGEHCTDAEILTYIVASRFTLGTCAEGNDKSVTTAGGTIVARVGTSSTARFHLPTRPLSFTPPSSGIGAKSNRPTRRLKNGINSLPRPSPNVY